MGSDHGNGICFWAGFWIGIAVACAARWAFNHITIT